MVKFIYERDEGMEDYCCMPRVVIECDAVTASDLLDVFKQFMLTMGYSDKTVEKIQFEEGNSDD